MLFNPSLFYRTPCGKRDGRTSCRSNSGPRTQQQKVPCASLCILVLLACKMYSGDMMRHAFGSFDHNSWSAQGAVRSAAHRFVHTFLCKLLVCPQIRPLFYPQTAGGSTDSSTNCHFCPQAAFLTANHDVCRHTRPQCGPQRAAFVRRFVRKLFSSGCKVESRFVRAWPPLSADLFA